MKEEIRGKIMEILSSDVINTESGVSHLMNLIRKRIEHMSDNERKGYSALKLFCDWAAHVIIDRSTRGIGMLQEMNEVLNVHKNDTDLLIVRIYEALFKDFMDEMYEFLRSLALPDNFLVNLDGEGWNRFLNIFKNIIMDCPLTFSDAMGKKAKELCLDIKGNPINDRADMWVIGLIITKSKNIIDSKLMANKYPLLSLVIVTSNTTRIVFPL